MKVDVVGGVAYAYLSYLVRADVRGIDHTMVLRGRNTFVLHRSGDSWKLIHYHESLSRDHNQEVLELVLELTAPKQAARLGAFNSLARSWL